MLAGVRPAGKPAGTWVLPNGQLGPGESTEAAALREVVEETGVPGRLLAPLGETRYWFSWQGERAAKVVTFLLVRYESGRLDDLAEELRHEVAESAGSRAPELLAHRGEREIAARATVLLATEEDV
jgi:8-oxo-dGTP pyrophosphatase MutT (NUDIX family)